MGEREGESGREGGDELYSEGPCASRVRRRAPCATAALTYRTAGWGICDLLAVSHATRVSTSRARLLLRRLRATISFERTVEEDATVGTEAQRRDAVHTGSRSCHDCDEAEAKISEPVR